jgi:AcrR family transcriptional regulator
MKEPGKALKKRGRGRPVNLQRKNDIAAVAARQIARDGLEGLRIRKIASEAGISHATLLHSFPSKQSVIMGVVAGILEDFRGPGATEGARTGGSGPPSALEQLREEFADLRRRMTRSPGLFMVLTELDMHGRRDPQVAGVLSTLYGAWRDHLVSLFKAGMRSGVFRPDLDPRTAAMAMMVQIKAAGYHAALAPAGLEGERGKEARELISTLARQVERWVTPHPPRVRRGGAL